MNIVNEAYDYPVALRDSEQVGDREDENYFENQANTTIPEDAYLEPAFCPTEQDMEELRNMMMESYMQGSSKVPEGEEVPNSTKSKQVEQIQDNNNLPPYASKFGINEQKFVQYYLLHNTICYWNGAFHDRHGTLTEDALKREIATLILPYCNRNLERTANSLVGALRMYASIPAPLPNIKSIPVANGTLKILETGERDMENPTAEQKFTVSVQLDPYLDYCDYRLPVEFHERAARPLHWLDFLDSLLEPDDIDTLQEYLGYLLIPTTKAQKMLCIIGQGGEGKSVIGGVVREILGDAVWFSSIQKIETNRFARADLAGKLCMIDDDMQMNALSSTGILKSMVTSTGKFDVERKGRQSVQELMYCRFLCFGNGALSALYDRTNGFFRRQILLKTKPKDKHRVDDPWLLDKLVAEKEGIFLWMIAGLIRLVEQNFQFTISDSAKKNLREMYFESNNMEEFLRDTNRLTYGVEEQITSKRLCLIYRKWCEDNSVRPVADQNFLSWVKDNGARFGIEFKKSVREGTGYYHGFIGVSGSMM